MPGTLLTNSFPKRMQQQRWSVLLNNARQCWNKSHLHGSFILAPRHSRLIYDLMLRVFLCVALSCSGFCEMRAGREPEAAQTIQELQIGIQNKAPSTYFPLATALFRRVQTHHAASWQYVR